MPKPLRGQAQEMVINHFEQGWKIQTHYFQRAAEKGVGGRNSISTNVHCLIIIKINKIYRN